MLLLPLDLVDADHLEASHEDRTKCNDVLGEVAPHAFQQALLHEVVYELSILYHEKDHLVLAFGVVITYLQVG